MNRYYEERTERLSRDFDQHDETISSTNYRSSMSPRITNVGRSRPTGFNTTSGVSTRIYINHSSTGNTNNYGPGLASLVNYRGVPLGSDSTALVSINAIRQNEKHDLEKLNDKFAQYVEKVRFLEAHNRKLALEIDVLRNRSLQGSSHILEMYDVEIVEANKLIADTKRDTAIINDKKQRAEQELLNQKARYNHIRDSREIDRREIDSLQLQIAENEAQIALFRRRMNDLDDESRRYKSECQRISSEINRLQNDIQNELFLKSSCEVEKISLEDDLINIKQIHEADLAELRSKSITNDLDPSDFFRNELSEAIREIRHEYETTIDNQRNDLRNRYSIIMNEIIIQTQQYGTNPIYNDQQRQQMEHIRNELLEIQNQNSYLRNKNQEMINIIEDLKHKIRDLNNRDKLAKIKTERDIDEARRRLEYIEHVYTDATTLKTTLEKEISTYRQLLENLRGCTDRVIQNAERTALKQSNNNNYLYNKDTNHSKNTLTKTTTISRTFINTTNSNSNYLEPTNDVTFRSYPSSSSNYNRTSPIHNETNLNRATWATVIPNDNLRHSNSQENIYRNSRSSSDDNFGNDQPQSPEYETLADT